VGCDADVALVESLCDHLPDGGLVMRARGEPEMGNSATLSIAKRARLQSERLRRVMGRVELLPAAQRRALTSAGAWRRPKAPDIFLVALVKLNLLIDVTTSRSSSTPPP
jgi:hypothetical protein